MAGPADGAGEAQGCPEASLFSLAYFEAVERGNRAKAINWLRQAVDAGAVADWLSDPDLESLHGSEFDALVERARRNAETQRAK